MSGVGRRLTEASRMGFRRAVVPAGAELGPAADLMDVVAVADIATAISATFGADRTAG